MRWEKYGDENYINIIKSKKERQGHTYTTDEMCKWLKDNDIDEKYNCLKLTRRQRKETFSEKYSGYIYFRKDLYDIDDILNKIEYIANIMGGSTMRYLIKPPQSWEYIKKIKIKK